MLKVGLVSTAGEKARGVLEVGLAGAIQEDCQVRLWPAYAALVDALAEGEEDVAWLPPIAYLRARSMAGIRLLATIERDGKTSYGCALLGRTDTAPSLAGAEGKRALWIDPWSAAGYLVPRALIRGEGFNPDSFFSSQGFVATYHELLAALDEGRADVGGCYCRLDDRGRPTTGPWQGREGVAVIASGGPIPGDTLCAGPSLANASRLAQLQVTLTGKLPPPALLVVLQATSLRPPVPGDYDEFEARYGESKARR